jgi:CelD/BcsL family acetyltransferase involved in cellulose biosynthesis
MTIDWLRTWWEFYGAGCELRIFVFSAADQVVGLLPLYLEQMDVGLAVSRVARLVGASIPPKAFDPPVDPEWSGEIFKRLQDRLFGREGVDLLSFGPVSERWPGQAGMRAALTPARAAGRVSWQAQDVLTVFELPASFDEYLKSLGKNERQTRKEKVRQLARHCATRLEVVTGADLVPEEFERFLVQHTEQWRAEGRGGHFHSWPAGVTFHRALVHAPGNRDRLLFVRLLGGESVIANRYVYRLGKRLYSELPSRAVGRDWDRLGLGTTSYFKFIEAAIGLGISEINSGLGHYDYKLRLGGKEISVGTWRVVCPRRWSRLKVRALLAATRVVRFFLHKVWHRRIVPHLPGQMGRTQSRFWLRYDV